jgi:predicted dehydrogenase
VAAPRVGVVGCGDVANYVYLPTLAQNGGTAAVCDLDEARARSTAARFGIGAAFSDLERFLAEAPVDAIVNLTPNQHHARVTMTALRAGKHVYTEKTLALTPEEADDLVAEADRRGLVLASAPAVVLNPAVRVARRLLDDGAIGRLCFAAAHYSHQGPARAGYFRWYQTAMGIAGHQVDEAESTDPSWFYRPGAGPLFDLGVYALHGITGLLGPVRSVTAMSSRRLPELLVEGGIAKGRRIPVEVDDSSLLLLDFGDGLIASLDTSYNVLATKSPPFELYGSEGVIALSPQASEGAPLVELYRDGRWEQPEVPGPRWHLGSGVPDFLAAVSERRKPTISAEQARHVVEVIVKAYRAAESGQTQAIERTF